MGADDLKSTLSKLKKSRAELQVLKILVEEVERRRKGGEFQKLTPKEMKEAFRDPMWGKVYQDSVQFSSFANDENLVTPIISTEIPPILGFLGF